MASEKCSKCSAPMVSGYIPDTTYGGVVMTNWHEGEPVNIFLRGICACALAVAMMIAAHQPSVARDRPGTPKDITANGCDFDPFDYLPRLCGTFVVTATEENRTEVEVTRNGSPVGLNAKQVFCPNQRAVCWNFQAVFRNTGREINAVTPTGGVQGGATRTTQVGETVITYGWKDLDFGAQYCFHFRARRTSDQVVSEIWSAWACAKTPSKPSVPVSVEFSVGLSGTQMLDKPKTAVPGATAQVIPEKMEIRYPATQPTTASYLYVFVYPPGVAIVPWKPGEGKPPTALYFAQHLPTSFTDEFKIPDNLTVAVVQTCGGNISGQTCATKNVSIINSGQIELPHPTTPVVRPTGPQAQAPAPMVRPTGRPETGPAAVAAVDQAFMAGTDLPGSDYRSAPLNDANPTTCKTMCATDAKCLAWTFVKPGVQNAKAMCWLKNGVPVSHPNPNVTSGIKVTREVIH